MSKVVLMLLKTGVKGLVVYFWRIKCMFNCLESSVILFVYFFKSRDTTYCVYGFKVGVNTRCIPEAAEKARLKVSFVFFI